MPAWPRQVAGEVFVGFQVNYWSFDYFLSSCYQNTKHYFRGFVQFDLTSLQHDLAQEDLEVMFASLRFRVTAHHTNFPEHYPGSCAVTLSVATAPGHAFGAPKTAIAELPDHPASDGIAVDVTEALRNWVTGRRPNYGFTVETGSSLPPQKDDFDRCTTYFRDFHLLVDVRKRTQ